MTSCLATVGILSIGDMGLGISKLLTAHGYRVVTNLSGRSKDTHDRASAAGIESLTTDAALVDQADYILSIVPPRDALPTAQRISTALSQLSTPRSSPLYFLDLNAISPRSARAIHDLFPSPAICRFIDGGIIGGPPFPKAGTTTNVAVSKTATTFPETSDASLWNRPSIPTSGPYPLSEAPVAGADLASTLHTKHISTEIGSASGLKCCFASTTKGFTALLTQTFTTASELGVLGELKSHMQSFAPNHLAIAEGGGVTSMPPKAYRWVREMQEIGQCHADDGGWEGKSNIFESVGELYRVVAEETVLGEEKIGQRKRGRTIEDVAEATREGLKKMRKE